MSRVLIQYIQPACSEKTENSRKNANLIGMNDSFILYRIKFKQISLKFLHALSYRE